MAKQAPDPIDVQDFQFILHCRLKIFSNEDNALFSKPCNLVAAASRFGLVFIGTTSPAFQVIQFSTIEKHSRKEGEITNYGRRNVPLPSPPKHLAVNCDCTKLAVVVEKNDCPIGLIYDIISMMKQVLSPPVEIRLSPTPGVTLIETSWNPTIPNIFTACKSDGTLGLYEFKETGVDINELPAESQATCMCWSPKGKQIAVGSHNGKITQYKPDLKAMKVVNVPPLEGSPSVIVLQWISNYQFIAVYKPHKTDNGTSLLVVDAPKTGETVYTNYDDICYSYGNTRPVQFYTVFQPTWNVLMVASSNSMEVGVLGNVNEQWMQWILADSARAELPLSASKQETLPVGLAFDVSATEPVIWGESSLPPAPYLLLLSHHGLLSCFRVINIKAGVASICQAPEPLADTSGLNQFTSTGPVEVAKVLSPEPEKQTASAVSLSKSVEAPLQPPLSFSQSTVSAASKLPQVPLFTSSPSSLFGSSFPFQPPKSQSGFPLKPDSGSSFVAKSTSQNLFGVPVQQQPLPATIVTPVATVKTLLPTPSVTLAASRAVTAISTASTVSLAAPVVSSVSTPTQGSESNVGQEEADILILKLIREECETLETELKALLHKGHSVKIDLGTDTEAVELVHGTDMLEDFLNELNETMAGQTAEVHSLKQGLIQTWAWYEDARSRFAQTQDVALETLLRIQKLDPVSQRYLADIQHMTYYLNSQIIQASRVLDEQWEHFQDSCKKIVRLKIPTMETIYQTMVRQSAIYQRQQYVLKDISNRIRAQRSKLTNPSLLVSLNNADQLEKELLRLQLEPQHLLQAHYEKVFQNQQRLTTTKIQKLSKFLLDREVTRVTYNRPKLSTIALQSAIQASPRNKSVTEPSLLGAGLSPISSKKLSEPRVVDFKQSTPKPMPTAPIIEQKQNAIPIPTSLAGDAFKMLVSSTSNKFSFGPVGSTSAPVIFTQLPASTAITATAVKTEQETSTPAQFKFSAIPTTSVLSLNTSTSVPATSASQLNFSIPSVSTTTKATSAPSLFTVTPVSQTKSIAETSQTNLFSFTTSTSATKPSASFGSLFGSAKPTSTFSFNLTTTTAPVTASAKPLASTASSAFVPTTQLSFSFNAKASSSASVPSMISTASSTSKTPTFVFGTTSLFGSAKDSSTAALSQAVSTSALPIPSTTAATVTTAVVTTAATLSIFGGLKVSSANVISVTTPASSAVPASMNLFKISTAQTPAVSSVFQGLLAPKATVSGSGTQQSVSESAAVPSTETTVSASSNDKTTPVTASSNQSPLFGTVTVSAASPTTLFSSANSTTAKVNESVTPVTTVALSSGVSVPTTKSEKESLVFGKVSTSAGSLFGAATTTAMTPLFTALTSTATSGSIFGAAVTTVSAGSIFGTTAAPTSTTGSIFGSVTATSATGSIFGTAVTTKGSVFGTPAAVSTAGSIFRAPATTTAIPSIFSALPTTSNASASIFGSSATAATSASLFGAAAATTASASLFGAVVSQQGSLVSTTTTTSSSAPIFSSTPAATVSSTVFTTGVSISTPTTTTITSSSVFAFAPTTATSIFGSVPTTSSTSSGSLFNVPVTTTASIFGAVATAATVFGSPGFGATTTTASSIFGQPASTGSSAFGTAATSPVFGVPPKTTASSPFGAPVFGSTSASPFGSTTTASGSVFGQPAAFGSGSVFGAPVSSSANTFGSAFGANSAVFGTPNTASSAFGQAQSSTFSFAAAAANVPSTDSAFGFSKPSTFGFGAAPASTNSSSFSFGNLSVGSPTTTANAGFGSGFGQSPTANPFAKAGTQEQKPAFAGGSLFGTPTTTTSGSIFGGSSTSGFGSSAFGSSPGFGSTSTFGQQPAFGQSSFGGSSFGSPSHPGPFSGGNQSVAQTGFGAFGQAQKPAGFGAAPVFGSSPGGFGSPPAFGSTSPAFGAAPAFGSPPKLFGSPGAATGAFGASAQQENPTFANLATQNTLGFGSLAQQSPTNPPMSSFSGGSSFSTWR